MKILRIYPKLPPNAGGMEIHIQELTHYQQQNGHQVRMAFNSGDKINSNDLKLLPRLKIMDLSPRFLWIILFNFSLIFVLLFKKVRVDILHIHGDWSNLVFMGIIKRLTSARKIVFSIHGQIEHYQGIKKQLLFHLLKKTDLIFCTGYESYQKVKDKRPTIFQPSGIQRVFLQDCPAEPFPDFTIVTVANLEKVKNLDLVIQIAAELPDCSFIIIGNGTEESRLKDLANSLSLSNLKFAGFQKSGKIADILCKAHIYLLTSEKEGTSTSILEAMSCGLPIICSPAGGIKKIIKEQINGFVIGSYSDPAQYVKMIKMLKNDKELHQQIKKNNIMMRTEFSWSNVAANITKLMHEEN